jgi:hypothetical protein
MTLRGLRSRWTSDTLGCGECGRYLRAGRGRPLQRQSRFFRDHVCEIAALDELTTR